MSPEDLAALHPRLFHVTTPGAWPRIARNGLLPPARLLDLYAADDATRAAVLGRRGAEVVLRHPEKGEAVVMDNLPLDEAKLARVLDDGLAPADWLGLLNERTFFWTTEDDAERLRGARAYRGRERLVLVADTLSLARAHADRIEIAPFNTGQTLYVPTRRGRSTFTPLGRHSFGDWSRLRGLSRPDRIKEVTVPGGVPDIAAHVAELWEVGPWGRRVTRPPRARHAPRPGGPE
jgi:hypothetical protein